MIIQLLRYHSNLSFIRIWNITSITYIGTCMYSRIMKIYLRYVVWFFINVNNFCILLWLVFKWNIFILWWLLYNNCVIWSSEYDRNTTLHYETWRTFSTCFTFFIIMDHIINILFIIIIIYHIYMYHHTFFISRPHINRFMAGKRPCGFNCSVSQFYNNNI